eukprot:495527_1
MAHLQAEMLLSMGYPKEYIERAIDVHQKSKYGTNWNLSILVEIIVRLQEKDKQQHELLQFQPSQPPNHNQNHNNAALNHNYNQNGAKRQSSVALPLQQSYSQDENDKKDYFGYLGDNYRDDLSDDDDAAVAAPAQPAMISPGGGAAPKQPQEDPFVPHYPKLDEPLCLKVNDYVDYRYENGRYLLCKIIAKSVELNHMMLLHPVGKPIHDTKYDRLVDIYQDVYKLSPAKSICLRKIKLPSHKLYRLRVGDYIDINPFCNGHNGWKNGKIIKLDPNSSQIKAVYHNETDNKNYSFWFHLLNTLEVAVFRSRCNNVDKHQLNLEYASIRTPRYTDDFKQNINDDFVVPNRLMKDENEDKFEEPPQIPQQQAEEEDVDIQYADEDDVFLTQSLSCPEVTDGEIAAYLLKFEDAKWEFNSQSVEIYRLQCNRINHAQMLPHPLDIRFPQYFSSSTIPPKKQFFANVLPPENKKTFPTKCRKWKIRVIVEETTATRLIGEMVTKLKNSLNRKDIIESEFMLKVVGCEEYMLYDENRLIIDYEAVRKAVRNEDNVIFQLLHCPKLKQIERECFSLNMRHISKYKTKYMDTNRLTQKLMSKHKNKLKYCKHALEDGKSWNELKSLNDHEDAKEDSKGSVDSFDIPLRSDQFGDDEDDAKENMMEMNPIFSNIPSTKDTVHLLDTVVDHEKNELFFHTLDELYTIKILFLVNVTQFPLYKHHVKNTKNTNKKWAIVIRHELWIGDLEYEECSFHTDYKHKISDGMRFKDSALFKSKKRKYCDLARESCISFTVYLCKLSGNDKDPFEQEIPIAFVRFPLISEYNVMRKGKYSLNLWPIPLFVDYYKGPKKDAYANLSFRYRGPTIDRHLKRFNPRDNELQNVFKLGIEFVAAGKNKKTVIVALPLNYRCEYKKGRNCKQDALETAQELVNCDLLHTYNDEEKQIIWKHRDYLCKFGSSLSGFLRCVDWRDKKQRSECYDYVESKWQRHTIRNEDLLELLSYEFMDAYIREWCVMRIACMSDNEIQIYLLQLVQCLKYELHHNNALIRLLMRRALHNPNQIGHFLFWHLKSEYLEVNELSLHYVERFALYLEEYLLFAPTGVARDILIECNLSRALMIINNKLRHEKKENKTDKAKLKEMMRTDLHRLVRILPSSSSGFILPISSKYRCSALEVDECKLMSSAQMPLWLTFRNCDAHGDPIEVIFKAGDDLRQDILTLSMIRVLDAVWLDRGLNLNLLPYNVVSTGDGQGMVECVSNAATTTHIHTKYGGGAQKGARDETTHLKYIYDMNDTKNEADVAKAIDLYTRSCAGYCMASYILGLGDRHPSNIMVRRKGELFHIDFAHFLGNFKSQKVIGDYVKWQREVAPFVFLSANKFCITNGGKNTHKYNEFVQFSVNAYLAVRMRHKLLINLFILMLPSQMPELICKEHINYLRDQLHLTDVKNHDVHKHINTIINVCLNDKRRIMDNMIHAMVHQ